MTDKKRPEALRDARWYMVDKMGMATLCKNKKDAGKEARAMDMAWPHMGPHRAVQLVEAADVEALRAGYAAARLEIESLKAQMAAHADELTVAHLDGLMRTRSVAPDPRPVVEMCAKALAEELAAWDIDPPLHHVKEAHDACELWLAAIDADRAMRAAQPAGAQAAPELTETAITAKNPAAPVSSFEDSRTQAVYEVLVNDNYPPAGSNEHWEGWKARLIVDALFPIEAPAQAAPAAVAGPSEFPHEQMDAVALARYKVVPSHESMFHRHAVVAGDGSRQLYIGREVECQNMAHKFAGAFLDGAFAFHSMLAAAPTTQPAPQQEAQEQAAWNGLTDEDRERALKSMPDMLEGFLKKWGWLHFANAIENICKEKNPPNSPASQGDALDAARYRYLRDGDWREHEKLESVIRLQLNTANEPPAGSASI